MAGMDEDDYDDETALIENPAPKLPDGIEKETIQEGIGFKRPKSGDEVTVHYVGTLESNGSEFDSSRSREKAFSFCLGVGDVIKGWDLGVATMKQGEIAKFTLAPEYAYGDAGSPPNISAGATLVFEVELLSWISKNDLFQDGGVIKSQLKEGSGWKKPSEGDEVRIDIKIFRKDGTVVDEKNDFEYVLGSQSLGTVAKTVDKALSEMNKGEEISLLCTPQYAGPEGEKIDLVLHQIYQTNDVSLAKDKSLMKKQVVEGEGWDMPKDAATIKLSILSATDGTNDIPGFVSKTLEFTAGNGQVCDAFECVVADMKLLEKVVLTCTDPSLASEEQIGLKDVTVEKIVFTLELSDFEKAKDTWNMAEEEKLAFGAARKDVGTSLFKAGRWRMALERYKKVVNLFSYLDSIKDENNKQAAKDLKKVAELNCAACNLKLKDFPAVRKTCDALLKDEPSNVKALFRRAQAHLGEKSFMDCMTDLKKVVEVDPQNREARNLMKEAQASQKEEDKKSKGLFAKMLGKADA